MVKFMSYEDSYFDICQDIGNRTVIYGIGKYGKRIFPYLKNVSYICDRRAEDLREWNGVPVILPEELNTIKEPMFIVLCVKSEAARKEMKNKLTELQINAFVFDYFDNIAFDCYKNKTFDIYDENKTIRYVHIICESSGWILDKFAMKMAEELEKQGIHCSVSEAVDPQADINHHVIYASCEPMFPDYNETFMITHIDSYNKLEYLKHQLKKAKMGICMSRETMERLAAYGVPREKLCYINPAQDNVIKPKKYVLGITHKVHNQDHRKNEEVLIELCKALNPDYFAFKIMGSGWNDIVAFVRSMGFLVEYYDKFDYEEYVRLIPSLDFYLFWGFDEGSMGYLDALRAGVETIVTPQGYHLDVKDGITYECRTIPEFIDVLLRLQEKREKRVKSVETWTWKNFTDKHLEVWNYLLGNEDGLFKNQHMYEDGIFSVLRLEA